ncbi:MAG: hypothetical protein ACI8P3_004401 [Saprospiraceae bacterium]
MLSQQPLLLRHRFSRFNFFSYSHSFRFVKRITFHQLSGKLNDVSIEVTSIFVNDPNAAFLYYTETLGFEKLMYMPEANLAIVVAPEAPDGTALLLEPNSSPFVKTYQETIYEKELPAIVLDSENI